MNINTDDHFSEEEQIEIIEQIRADTLHAMRCAARFFFTFRNPWELFVAERVVFGDERFDSSELDPAWVTNALDTKFRWGTLPRGYKDGPVGRAMMASRFWVTTTTAIYERFVGESQHVLLQLAIKFFDQEPILLPDGSYLFSGDLKVPDVD